MVKSHHSPDRLIDLSRAAHLAGVTRVEIQRLIAAGQLVTFEGKVQVSDLARIYPEVSESPAAMLEIVSQIKDDAIIKGLYQRMGHHMTDIDELRGEIKRLQQELAFSKERTGRYKHVIIELRPKLAALQRQSEEKQRIQAIIDWLVHKTKELW